MAIATETQAGGMDPDFSQNGRGILVGQSCKHGAVSQIQKEEREEERKKHTLKMRKRLHLVHHTHGTACRRLLAKHSAREPVGCQETVATLGRVPEEA